MNVYGSKVSEATVRRQPGYVKGNPVTKFDMAKLAMEMINDEKKLERARAYLKGLADDYGSLNGVATKGIIYNATGETMKFLTSHDYQGHFGDSMPPEEIHNGQWGVFFHQKPSFIPGASEGAVVYGHERRCFVLSWWTRYAGQNHCYSSIRLKEDLNDSALWDDIADLMWDVKTNQHKRREYPHEISTAIGDTSVCEFSAIVKLIQ